MGDTIAGVPPFARSPLADRAADLAAFGAMEIRFLTQVNLRVDPAAAARLGLAIPTVANTWRRTGGREALWLGPDEWLVVAEPGSAPAIVEELERALNGLHHSVVDVSADRAVVELAGDERRELLSRGCGLDLHPRSWRDGECAQTLLARIPVLLQEREQATRVFVRASFSGHLVDWLQSA
ncbi:MAG TPA: sarcosine oxidase subunit gamma family protein [Actinomycetes bacterium]